MNRDDDADWVDALAGRPAGAGPGAREGAHLRRALAQRRAGATADPVVPATLRQDQLVARAQVRRTPPGQAARWRRASWLALAASIAVVGVGLGVNTWLRTVPPEAVVRAAAEGPVRVEVDDPAQAQRDLLAALQAAGVAARGYEMFGRLGVDADLPSPPPPAVRAVLERFRLPQPGDGTLRVEFAPRAGP